MGEDEVPAAVVMPDFPVVDVVGATACLPLITAPSLTPSELAIFPQPIPEERISRIPGVELRGEPTRAACNCWGVGFVIPWLAKRAWASERAMRTLP